MKTLVTTLLLLGNALIAQEAAMNFEEALNAPTQVKNLELNFYDGDLMLPDKRIAQMANLESIKIRNYGKENLELPKEIVELPMLKKIGIQGDKLNQIPLIIFDIENLEELTLGCWKVESIPKEISNLTKLKYLYLRSDIATALPESIYKLKDLERLSINGEMIEEVPTGISNLSKLKNLIIHVRHLKKLPQDLEKLSVLEEFSFYCINDLSDQIKFDPSKMRRFRWGQCQSFPSSICELINLEILILDVGKINEIPNCISNLKKLKELGLSFQPITSLPDEILDLNQLRELGLYSTEINDIDMRIFELPELRRVDLSYCNGLSDDLKKQLKAKFDSKVSIY